MCFLHYETDTSPARGEFISLTAPGLRGKKNPCHIRHILHKEVFTCTF